MSLHTPNKKGKEAGQATGATVSIAPGNGDEGQNERRRTAAPSGRWPPGLSQSAPDHGGCEKKRRGKKTYLTACRAETRMGGGVITLPEKLLLMANGIRLKLNRFDVN